MYKPVEVVTLYDEVLDLRKLKRRSCSLFEKCHISCKLNECVVGNFLYTSDFSTNVDPCVGKVYRIFSPPTILIVQSLAKLSYQQR